MRRLKWNLKPPGFAQKQAQRPEREATARARALTVPFPLRPCALHPAAPSRFVSALLAPPHCRSLELPSTPRQGGGPTHLSLTAWMASAALS